MRVKVDYRTASIENYKSFCKQYPDIELDFDDWRLILYTYMDMFKEHLLETGKMEKLPSGFGEFFINKRKSDKTHIINKKEKIVLPIDWKKTKEKGKKVYNFNFHTEGYRFGWLWNKAASRIKFSNLWYFKASRTTSRLLSHYLKADDKYQHIYVEWLKYKRKNNGVLL